MKKKWFVTPFAFGIMVLFICFNANHSFAFNNLKKFGSLVFNGKTLYVGGSGEGNYTKIQDAIDNASDGDTIFVYAGWYNESILINKSISLYGQDKNMTFIGEDDNPNQYTIIIRIEDTNNVSFKGFTIQKRKSETKSRILIEQMMVHVKGIGISNSNNVMIIDNCVKNCDQGVTIAFSNSVLLSNNIIQNCTFVIYIFSTRNATIRQNVIDGDKKAYGIWVYGDKKTIIERNIIKNNLIGVYILGSYFTSIMENNFFQNKKHATFYNSFFNVWSLNYWNRSRILPKIIRGGFIISLLFVIPLINFDWHPAKEPYDIGV